MPLPLVCLTIRPNAGTDTGHHCHATGAERSWQMARTAQQAAAQAQQAAAQATAAPPSHPASYGAAAWAPPPPRVGPPATVPGVLPAGHVRQPPSAPEHLPDPATLPGLLHLSSLRLAVKVPKDAKHTVGELQARLAPFGLCVKDARYASDGSGPLGLRALFAATTNYSASRNAACPAMLRANSCVHSQQPQPRRLRCWSCFRCPRCRAR